MLPTLLTAYTFYKAEEYEKAAIEYQKALDELASSLTKKTTPDSNLTHVDCSSTDTGSLDSLDRTTHSHSCFSWVAKLLK